MRFDRIRAVAFIMLMALFLSVSMTGCATEDPIQVVLTTGFSKEEVFRIESRACMRPEVLVYLTNIQNSYEKIYGSGIWEMDSDNGSLEEELKDTVLYRLAQLKVMDLMAEKYEVSLTPEETELVKRASDTYFQSLNDDEKRILEVDEDIIHAMYVDYALADKVYHYIIRDVNPEISDDEARILTLGRILIKTYHESDKGERSGFTPKEKNEAYARAVSIREEALESEDFDELVTRYNEGGSGTISFGKGEVWPSLEEEAFRLETGEIGQLIETDEGYQVIKCLATFNREETDANKEKIISSKRRQVFGAEYSTFADSLTRIFNEDMWNDIALIRDKNVKTDSFFSVYNEYLEGAFD